MQLMPPKISIILPVYNNKRYIIETLDSIAADSYPNKELVLLNDGSTDGNHAVIETWIEQNKHKLSVVYKARANKGITASLNELLAMSSGEYIAYFCSDDLMLNGGLAKRVNYLQNNPGKLAVFANAHIIDTDGKLLHEDAYSGFYKVNKQQFYSPKTLKEEIVKRFAVPGPVLMLHKHAFAEVGSYDERLSYEDWDLYLRLVSKNLLGFLDEPVCYYRVHSGNTCRSKAVVGITADNPKIVLKQWHAMPEYRTYFTGFLLYNFIYLQYLKLKFFLLEKEEKNLAAKGLLKGLLALKNRVRSIAAG